MEKRKAEGGKDKKVQRSARLAAVICAGMLLMFAAGCNNTQEQESVPEAENLNAFTEGTTLAGLNISGKTIDQALQQGRQNLTETMDAFEISVKFGDDTLVLKGADFESQDLLELVLPRILKGRKAGGYDINYVIDLSAQGKQKVFEAAANCYTQAKNATVETFDGASGDFVFTKEVNGVKVNVEKTLKNIRQVLAQKQGATLQAELMEEKAEITQEMLKQTYKKISSYSTVSTNTANGNSNMELSLSRINGTVIEPGQVFSYNDTLGDSTNPDNGWLPANGIAGGELVQMYGGGICQTSSTLYVAVLKAGLDIVERHCHSMVSTYLPIGQDATVDYGNLDFRFQNNLKNPIYISAWMDGVTLYVNIYGVQPAEWDSIEVYSETVESYGPPAPQFKEDASLAKGAYQLKNTSRSGSSAVCSRTFYKDGAAIETQYMPDSYYPPAASVFLVGPGTDTSKVDTSRSSGNIPTPTPAPTPVPQVTPAPTPVPTPEPTPEPTPQPEEPEVTTPEEGA